MSKGFDEEMLDTEPIKVFADEKELKSCMRKWKRILFLDDWAIAVHLVPYSDLIDENGNELVGNCKFDFVNKGANIRIAQYEPYLGGRVLKYCGELILVHELLHCKRNYLRPPENYEGAYYDLNEHAKLEEEARSYILARYNITKEWFFNVDE